MKKQACGHETKNCHTFCGKCFACCGCETLVAKLRKRIDWLTQKEQEQRRVGGPEFTKSDLLRGRTQGEIGGINWLIREVKA